MLPICDSRAQFNGLKYRCLHSFVKNNYVSPGMCIGCPVANYQGKTTTDDKSQPAVPPNIDSYNAQFTDQILQDMENNITNHKTVEGPGALQMMWNFTSAVAKYVFSGLGMVSKEEYAARLMICDTCEFRVGVRCKHKSCGCYLEEKAMLPTETCPMNKWPKYGV